MITPRRRLALVAAALVILGSIEGCSTVNQQSPTPSGSSGSSHGNRGQTLDAAREQLKSVAGLTDTSIEVDQTISGLNKHHQVLIKGTAEDAAKLPTLIDHLAQLGWSVNEDKPDTGVFIRLTLSSQPVIGDVARANGWADAAYATSTERLMQLVLLPESSVQQRFGNWPGVVPDTMS